MKVRRAILGIVSVTMVVTALLLWFFGGTGESPLFAGMVARIGVVLFTVFLAWPALERHADRFPAVITGTIAVSALFLAIRPKLLPLVLGMLFLLLVIHFGFRFVSRTFR
jgi:hypothetical protein